ncbi:MULTISPECIES: hypothetical protein [unclassified Arenibacter]|uniref:hypothetical protein n=1 Tax=unclassified Arenibacter TaxID=2615047 RepID=UPI000E346012|nr:MULTISPECIES: hypothetical protein [unclassified Arenibacter]MCM4165775.1 hypothetical protein [Arenibacter sp. A80]RFT54623.1 hypothetical protein D0S24_19400 [Arenibacter sp. P308M17]
MENQYCKVGAISSITKGSKELRYLEYQYQNFMDKAISKKYSDSKLAEFFELKAIRIQKIIQTLTH